MKKQEDPTSEKGRRRGRSIHTRLGTGVAWRQQCTAPRGCAALRCVLVRRNKPFVHNNQSDSSTPHTRDMRGRPIDVVNDERSFYSMRMKGEGDYSSSCPSSSSASASSSASSPSSASSSSASASSSAYKRMSTVIDDRA